MKLTCEVIDEVDYAKVAGFVYSHLYRYAKYVEAITDFEESALRQLQKMDGGEHVHTSYVSDPTARGGILLAEPPRHIAVMKEWVAVVDMAYEQLLMDDEAYNRGNRGIAYVMSVYFCLNGQERRDRSKNAETRIALAKRCKVTDRTIYGWLNKIGQTVAILAEKKGLLKDG